MRRDLPREVQLLFVARRLLRLNLNSKLSRELNFSLDGKLVGDIGEWIATSYYRMKLADENQTGFDGIIGDETVEVKATVSGDQASFRYVNELNRPKKLLVFKIYDEDRAPPQFEEIYNGSYTTATAKLYEAWEGQDNKVRQQRSIKLEALRKMNAL